MAGEIGMSLSPAQAKSFLQPLLGKTTTFLLPSREANLALARTAMTVAEKTARTCSVLDLDALYSSNADTVLGSLSADFLRSVTLTVPDPESRVEQELPRVLASAAEVVIIDSFNTLYHLLSYDDGWSRGRKLSFAVAVMSYLARTGRKAVILAMYRRPGLWRQGTRPISSLSDVTIGVKAQGAELSFYCERGTAWPEGKLSIRIP